MTFRKPSDGLPFAIMVPKPTLSEHGPLYGTIPLVSALAVGARKEHAVSFHWGGKKNRGGFSWPVERVGGIKIPISHNGDPATTTSPEATSKIPPTGQLGGRGRCLVC